MKPRVIIFPNTLSTTCRGAALVLVLTVMAILLGIALILLSMVGSERVESGAFGAQMDSHRLADTAVEVVKGTISKATVSPPDLDVAWASQPGMIRTWNTDGSKRQVFRLYSASSLVDEAADFDSATERSKINQWKGATGGATTFNALWCDINSPVISSSGRLNYPVAAPPSTLVGSSDSVITEDPSSTQAGVQGYKIDPTSALGWQGGTPAPGNNPMPMPVQWLYVLQDGTLAAPADQGTADSVTIPAATAANPVVGRIAYWTDDETCKVNLNTASEGNYWAAPRSGYKEDVELGQRQPAQNEFNRYPAHPMVTSLSAVLPSFDLEGKTDNEAAAAYHSLPRGVWGGSKLGKVMPQLLNDGGAPRSDVEVNKERLFASVDEFAFTAAAREPISSVFNGVTPASVHAASFFLTASSRAPETTLFDTPRVSLWPINTDATGTATYSETNPARQDAFDGALRFCASLNGSRYFFLRSDPRSATYDYAGIPRNQAIYRYLQDLTDRNVPGFGGSFVSKYDVANRDALLTQAFDFIRSGPNLLGASFSGAGIFRKGYATPKEEWAGNFSFLNVVVPIRITSSTTQTTTQGMGNSVIIKEAAIGFFCERVEALDEDGNVAFPTEWSTWDAATKNWSATGKTGTRPSDPAPPANLYEIILKTNPKNAKLVDRVRYTIRPYLMLGTVTPTYGYWRGVGVSPQILPAKATSGDNYFGFQMRAKELGGGLAVTADPASGGSGNASIAFPKGSGGEGAWAAGGLDPEYTHSGESGPSYLFFSPTWFLIKNGLSGYMPKAYLGDAIELTFPLPPSLANADPDDNTQKLLRSVARLEAIDTTKGGGPADGAWRPRFIFSGGKYRIDLAFGDSALAEGMAGGSQVIQSLEVSFPSATLPVPFINSACLAELGDANSNYQNLVAHGTPLASTQPFIDAKIDAVSDIKPGVAVWTANDVHKRTRFMWQRAAQFHSGPSNRLVYDAGDVIRSVTWTGQPSNSGKPTARGDWRVVALQPSTTQDPIQAEWLTSIDGSAFDGSVKYGDSSLLKLYQMAGNSFASGMLRYYAQMGRLVENLEWRRADPTSSGKELKVSTFVPNTAFDLNGAKMLEGVAGDWTTNYVTRGDGGIFDMPNSAALGRRTSSGGGGRFPFFNEAFIGGNDDADGLNDPKQFSLMYSPNREMFSPLQMGSLLTSPLKTSTQPVKPWQTLLFCANSAAACEGGLHPGAATPPDHLFADLFWMPTVDPYPISGPFSTAGKINMNYQIMPFTWIERKTGLYAAMKASRLVAYHDNEIEDYKIYLVAAGLRTYSGKERRFPINIPVTLKGFDDKFDAGELFRSATQICDIWFYPKAPDLTISESTGETERVELLRDWWKSRRLTGDNLREEPYSQLYPRLTTRSNTFTVHYRVQVLKKRRSGDATVWEEGKDNVVSEYRGHTTIERYIDPHDSTLPDFITDSKLTLGSHYRWRTLQSQQFIP